MTIKAGSCHLGVCPRRAPNKVIASKAFTFEKRLNDCSQDARDYTVARENRAMIYREAWLDL